MAQSLAFIPHQNPSGIGVYPLVPVGWTLNFEMFFYAWLSLMLLLFARRWFIACLGTLVLMPLVWSESWVYGRILGSLHLYEFAFGLVLGFIYVRVPRTRYVNSVALGLLFATAAVCLQIFDLKEIRVLWRISHIAVHLSAAAFVAATLCLDERIRSFRPFHALRFLGDISYSTYLLHGIVIKLALHYAGTPAAPVAEAILLIAITVGTAFFSYISYRAIETGPITRFFKKLIVRQRPATDSSGLAISP